MLSPVGPSSAAVGRPSSSEGMAHGLANSFLFLLISDKNETHIEEGVPGISPIKNNSSHDICSLQLEAMVWHTLCLRPSQPSWRAAQPCVPGAGKGLLAVGLKMEQAVSLKSLSPRAPVRGPGTTA